MTEKNKKIEVQGTEITIYSHLKEEYISITDIARYKDSRRTDYIIQNWMRNRNTIEFLGIWEKLNNPEFNPIEFDGFRKISGLPGGWRGNFAKNSDVGSTTLRASCKPGVVGQN